MRTELLQRHELFVDRGCHMSGRHHPLCVHRQQRGGTRLVQLRVGHFRPVEPNVRPELERERNGWNALLDLHPVHRTGLAGPFASARRGSWARARGSEFLLHVVTIDFFRSGITAHIAIANEREGNGDGR
jgi:hypothetical protein